jgi:prepilin-type N-terminal cleavage/methylation domain-containing protein
MTKNKIIKNKINAHSGFTLMETLLTISIFSIIMLGTTLMLKDILTNSKLQYGTLTNIDQANIIANNFVNEIRNGAYGANGAYPIGQASNTQIIFYSTAPKMNGTISKIRYYTSNNSLYEGITNPAGNPPTYDGQTENINTLSSNMSLGSNPLFYYYDGNYNGSGTPLASPVNINQVKFVKINLILLKDLVQNSTNTFTVTAGASMRNLKTNLGN